jgi:hypothetical protein
VIGERDFLVMSHWKSDVVSKYYFALKEARPLEEIWSISSGLESQQQQKISLGHFIYSS